jgi:hypothetical protein
MYIREPFPHTRLKIREMLGTEAKFTRLGCWDTLKRIVWDGYSVSRYGDGELSYFLKHLNLRFQTYLPELGERLREAITIPKDGVLTCYNNAYRDADRYQFLDMDGERNSEGLYNVIIGPDRRRQRRSYVERWIKIARKTNIRTFGDATCFRLACYVEEQADDKLEDVKEDFRSLFRGRRILFVCPEKPLAGHSFAVLEPLLMKLGLRDAQYIFVPGKNAAEIEPMVRQKIAEKSRYDDIFIQAGPLATVLAYEFAGTVDGRVVDAGALNCTIPFL